MPWHTLFSWWLRPQSSQPGSVSAPADFNHRKQRLPCTLDTQGQSGVALPKRWLGAEVVALQCCVCLPKATCQQGDTGACTGLVQPSLLPPYCVSPWGLFKVLCLEMRVHQIAAWSLGPSSSSLLVPGTLLLWLIICLSQ